MISQRSQPPKPNLPKTRLLRSLSKLFSGSSSKQSRARVQTGNGLNGVVLEEVVPARGVRRVISDSTLGEERAASLSELEDEEEDNRISRNGSTFSGNTGADTDASIRPISPTSFAASSVFSTSNSLAPTTNGTFKSSTSTKPTTLMSVEGTTNRIAVVSGAGATRAHIVPSTSGNSLSPLLRSITSNSTSDSPAITFSNLPTGGVETEDLNSTSTVPGHTLAHPRNNPHPASIPPDNASMLTLASSSFAPSISQISTSYSYSNSRGIIGLRASNLSTRTGRDDADEDASVRALAPSRRGSEESLARSTWSGVRKAASVKTMATTGTGGGDKSLGGAGIISASNSYSESTTETEAQRLARLEGGVAVKSPLAMESLNSSGTASIASETSKPPSLFTQEDESMPPPRPSSTLPIPAVVEIETPVND